jgi:hypothetical protein
MRLTIFTAPKPFTNPHINIIQRNALQSWLHLSPGVEVFMLGDEAGMQEVAAEYGIRHLKDVKTNEYGTPLISSIFDLARQAASSPLMAYINADILLFPAMQDRPGFVEIAQQVAAQAERFLVVGQRWDLDVRELLDFSPGWAERLWVRLQAEGKLHSPVGSDYFIFPRACYENMPPFAVGRPMWDNWTIYTALRSGWAVVDGFPSITIVHQNHDYAHLPGGRPPYRLPEASRNIQLAGGKRRAMYLRDVNTRLVDGKLQPMPHTFKRFVRSIEVFPVIKMNSYFLAQVLFVVYHPIKTFRKTRRWIKRHLRTLLKGNK